MSFLNRIVDQSSLTPRQLEALSNYVRVATGELKLREAASLTSQGRVKGRKERPLTVGSYYRTLSQARNNVRESLVTLIISAWLGVVKGEDIRRLFELVSGGARDLSEEETDRFIQLLEALLRRIVV